MAKPEETKYKLLSEWSITQQDKFLIISGGADARYEIELENNDPSFFSNLKYDALFSRSVLRDRDARILEELVTAEVVVPVLKQSKALNICIIGDAKNLGIAAHRDLLSADFLVVTRTKSTYAELLNKIDYQNITKPHLFVDLAFHHTLSVGPLVFPGETACIACLQGRITSRWGDEKPPITGRMVSKYLSVVTELIKTELDRIFDGDTSLTNKTCSWNFLDRAVRKDQLLKVPLCPICNKNKINRYGALALPWGKDESITNTV